MKNGTKGNDPLLFNERIQKDVVRWFAIYTKPRHEKKVADELKLGNIEYYLPLVNEVHQWSDRKKTVSVPLIRGYVFVHIPLKESLYVLQIPGVVRFVTFNRVYASIPDFQIEALKRILKKGYTLQSKTYLDVGTMVEVSEGPLRGVVGKIQRIENEEKFIISLDTVQASFAVRIDPACLKPISDMKKKKLFTLPLGMGT